MRARGAGAFDCPRDALVAMALAIGAAALRAPGLAPSSLWRDDAWPVLVVKASTGEAFRMGVWAPGFSLLMKGWLGVVGFSELRAQILPFVAGALAAPAIYLLARRLRLGFGPALVAGFVLLTSSTHVDISVRTKQYSLDCLAVIVVIYVGWLVVEAPGSSRRWAGLVAASLGATALSASVTPVVIAAFASGGAACWRSRPRRPRAGVVSLLSYTPLALLWWLLVLRPARTPSVSRAFSAGFVDRSEGLGRLAQSASDRVSDVVAQFTSLPRGPVLAVLVVTCVVLAVRRLEQAVLLAVPLLVALGLSIAHVAPLGGGFALVAGGRIDVYLYPCLALLLAAGLRELTDVIGATGSAVLTGAVVAVLVVNASGSRYPVESTRTLVRIVDEMQRPGDEVLVTPYARYAYALYTSSPIEIVFSPRFPTGFTVDVSRAGVRVLGGAVEDGYSDDALLGISQAARDVSPTSDRVFVLDSRFLNDLAGDIQSQLTARGFRKDWEVARAGAVLELWVRPEAPRPP